MTDKERLEDITNSVGILLRGDRHVLLRRKHYEWLIEQAERVQELEKQNKRYREALEEIARGRFPGASYIAKQALEVK